jgi:hypothetical protein
MPKTTPQTPPETYVAHQRAEVAIIVDHDERPEGMTLEATGRSDHRAPSQGLGLSL